MIQKYYICFIFWLFVCKLQVNLVASGASDSEIFIWDLNNAEKPMTPGTKAQVKYCRYYYHLV